jgi:hypothetical protein
MTNPHRGLREGDVKVGFTFLIGEKPYGYTAD